jgi:hypothetical protein
MLCIQLYPSICHNLMCIKNTQKLFPADTTWHQHLFMTEDERYTYVSQLLLSGYLYILLDQSKTYPLGRADVNFKDCILKNNSYLTFSASHLWCHGHDYWLLWRRTFSVCGGAIILCLRPSGSDNSTSEHYPHQHLMPHQGKCKILLLWSDHIHVPSKPIVCISYSQGPCYNMKWQWCHP